MTRKRERHGEKYSPTYLSWEKMKTRCNNPAYIRYKDYGGRGIGVCERWDISFLNFLEDMGERPLGCQLDRINNDDHYYKENCKWSTPSENSNNRRSNHFIEYDNKRLTISQWAREINISPITLRARISILKWPLDRALKKQEKKEVA